MAHPGDAIARIFREADNFLVAAHHNPDGDALGATAALAHLLLFLGKNVRLYNVSGIPEDLAWLDLGAPLVSRLEDLGNFTPDVAVMADCAEPHRAGEEFAAALAAGRFPHTVVIDHHTGAPDFAEISWVDPQAAATCLLVGKLAQRMGHDLSGPLGEGVYLGLISDTGSFTFSNTGADVFDMAGTIVRQGLDLGSFTARHANNWTLPRLHLWGELFCRTGLAHNGQVAYAVVPEGLLEKYGLDNRALEEFAAWLRRLRGVQVGIFIRPDGPGKSKASLRSSAAINVQRVAALLGGGGHKNAAGVGMAVSVDKALETLLPLVRDALGESCECGND